MARAELLSLFKLRIFPGHFSIRADGGMNGRRMIIGLLFGSCGVVGGAGAEIDPKESWGIGMGGRVPWPLAKNSAPRRVLFSIAPSLGLPRSITESFDSSSRRIARSFRQPIPPSFARPLGPSFDRKTALSFDRSIDRTTHAFVTSKIAATVQ